jgi:antitoxin (DNA-binding transcriptional repressor) of toxin-antitoxin stability system
MESDEVPLCCLGKDGESIMSATITVEEAQARLKELIGKLAPGEEVVITDKQLPVAKLVGERPARPPRPAPGAGKGSILYMAPDFDEPMDEFKEYTQ